MQGFFSGLVNPCDPRHPVPPGTSEREPVDMKVTWGQIAGFQPFPCDVVASSLAASPAAALGATGPGWCVPAVPRQHRAMLSRAVAAPGGGRDAASSAQSWSPVVLAPRRSVPGLALTMQLILMQRHLGSDAAWKQGLSIPVLSDGPALGNSSGFQQNPGLRRLSWDVAAAASSWDKPRWLPVLSREGARAVGSGSTGCSWVKTR